MLFSHLKLLSIMKKLILVTGSHRSGSTWTGKVIGHSKSVRYIQEPFNIAIKKYNSPLTFWFEHINVLHETNHQYKIKKYLNSFLMPYVTNGFQKRKNSNFLKHFYTHLLELHRKRTKRTLFKDPLALMSAEWIYKTYPTDVVVIIRHPAAFIASLKVKEWEFDFNNFLNQPNLMETYLKHYVNDIKTFSKEKHPILDQGILLWNILHSMILYYKKNYKNEWYFVKHEDLSLHPIKEFESLFNFLNIPFDKNVQDYLIKTTTSESDSKIKRDSKQNVYTWKERLDEDEIAQIKHGTINVWKYFYTQKDW